MSQHPPFIIKFTSQLEFPFSQTQNGNISFYSTNIYKDLTLLKEAAELTWPECCDHLWSNLSTDTFQRNFVFLGKNLNCWHFSGKCWTYSWIFCAFMSSLLYPLKWSKTSTNAKFSRIEFSRENHTIWKYHYSFLINISFSHIIYCVWLEVHSKIIAV